jgi:DnaK suppressor protein
MKKQEMEKFKHILLEKRHEILDKVQRFQASGREVSEDPSDLADAASSSYDKEFYFNRSNSERNTLMMIDDAIIRIERGRYGRCSGCGVHIENKRLEVVPWARYCVSCQEKREKGHLRD